MKKVLLVLLVFLLIGCSKITTYQTIKYSELESKMNNKDTFVLVIGSKECSACANYKITMEEVIKQYQLKIYFIDLADIETTDRNKLNSKFSFAYTPTTVFIVDGVEKTTSNRIVGTTTKSKIVDALTKEGYIKEK